MLTRRRRYQSWLALRGPVFVLVAILAGAAAGCGSGIESQGDITAVRSAVKATLKSIAVTPPATSLPPNTTQALAATGMYSNGTKKNLTATTAWSSSNPAVATVTSAGLVAAIAPGAATITATTAGVTGTAAITVTSASLISIAVTPANRKLATGATVKYTATALFSDGTKWVLVPPVVSWTSSSGAVATIAASGTATAVSTGIATIRATHIASGVAGTAKLTVTAAKLSTIALTPATPQVPVGLTAQFTAMGTYTDGSKLDVTGQVTWASSATSVATISSGGVATALSPGTATVTVVDPTSKKKGTATLTVTSAVLQSITLSPSWPMVPLGQLVGFRANGLFSNGTQQDVTTVVTWSSSAPAVATISNAGGSEGLATNASVGTTTITAFDPNTGLSQTTTLTVTAAVLGLITVGPPTPSLALGTTASLSATGTYSDGTTDDLTQAVTWSASNGDISISNAGGSAGQITGNAPGTAVVTATDPSTGKSGSITVLVTGAVLKTVTVSPAAVTFALGTSASFSAAGVYSDNSVQDLTNEVTWSASNGAVSISNAPGSSGVATGSSIGTATITATDPATMLGGSATATVTPALDLCAGVVCVAADACHVAGACSPASGTCSSPGAPDGTSCDDGNPCTQTDACQSGVCTGANPVVCLAADSCHVAGACDPTASVDATWRPGPTMNGPRGVQTATLLPSGGILVTGGFDGAGVALASAELFDPVANTWTTLAPMGTGRGEHTATLLPNGKVLVAGGRGTVSPFYLASAELFDPVANTWTPVPPMSARRIWHTATLLDDGKVLVTGGIDGSNGALRLASAEIFDPTASAWTPAPSMSDARYSHTATRLATGKVLVLGGSGDAGPLASAEIFDPVAGAWISASAMTMARVQQTATLLESGNVIVTGGQGTSDYLASAEIFDPVADRWTSIAPMSTARNFHTATLLSGGRLLVTGGFNHDGPDYLSLDSVEIFDEATGGWTPAPPLSTARFQHTATPLGGGKVLVVGGSAGAFSGAPSATTELFAAIGACSNPVAPDGSFCSLGGGPASCVAGLCAFVPTCHDGMKNGDETDIDCGGGRCAPCSSGLACQRNADCQSVFCGFPALVCQ